MPTTLATPNAPYRRRISDLHCGVLPTVGHLPFLALGMFAGMSISLLAGCQNQRKQGEFRVQLNWIMDAEYAGTYVALDRSYYEKRGVHVTLAPGGPTTPVPVKVASRAAQLGISSPDLVATAVAQGANLKIIAAVYQKSPFAIMSLAKAP